MARSIFQTPLSGGVDTGTDARLVEPNKLTSLVNGQYEKDGTIKKRRGYVALSRNTTAGGAWNAGTHLTTFGQELCMLDGTYIGSYSPSAGKWVVKDFCSKFGANPRKGVASGVASQAGGGYAQSYVAPDCAFANGQYVFSWLSDYWAAISGGTDRGEPTITALDATSGAQLLSAYNIEGVGNAFYLAPRLVAIGNLVAIVYADIAGNLYARTYDTTTQAVSARTTIATNLRASASCDYQVTTDGTNLLVVYENNSGASPRLSYTVRTTALAAVTNGTVNDNAYAGPFILGTCAQANEAWWITFATVNAGLVEWWNVVHAATPSGPTYTQTAAPARIYNGVNAGTPLALGAVRINAGVAAVTMSTTVGATTGGLYASYWRQVLSNASTSGPIRKTPHTIWASKPALMGGRTCAWQVYGSGLSPDSAQETMCLVDLLTDDIVTTTIAGRPAVIAAPRVAKRDGLIYTLSNTLPGLVQNGTQFTTVFPILPAFDQRSLDYKTVDTAPKVVSTELGKALHISGGIPQMYDGARVIEGAFLTYPEQPQTITHVAGAGSLTASSTYQYSIVATFTTSTGEVIRSAPSTPVSVAMGVGENTVRFWLPNLPWTLMGEAQNAFVPNVTFEVYRTTAGGSTFFRVPLGSIVDVSSGRTGPIINDPTVHARQYEDRASDSALSGQPIIYTQGGVLSSVTPPGSQIICSHKGRIFLADGKDVWFTTKSEVGLAPRWNELLRFRVEDGGDITALASLDSALIIFKTDRIYFVTGDGPDVTGGTGQEFSPPQRVATDLGCIDPRSIVVTPVGITFQANTGLYMLTRQLQVQYFSSPVRDSMDQNPTVTSAVVSQSWFQVRITMNSAGSTGVCVVWDYSSLETDPGGVWSTFQFYDTTNAQASSAIASACNWRGSYCWMAPNGTVYVEQANDWRDNGTFVGLSFETSWFKFAGLQGFQRVWSVALLGDRQTDHDVKFEYAVDYSATYESAITKNVTSAVALEEFRYVPRKQKCASMRVRITELTPSSGTVGTGRGFTVTGIAFETRTLPNINRLPSGNRS